MVSQENEVRIMVVEDDKHWSDWITDIIDFISQEGMAWSVVAYAKTAEGALDEIANHAQTQFTHIILDGNLGKSRYDGYQVAEAVVQQLPDVRIIGMSGSNQGELNTADRSGSLSQQVYVDKYVGKDNFSKESLVAAILSTLSISGNDPKQD